MSFYSIKNNSGLELDEMERLLGNFMPFSQKRMGYDQPVSITFESDERNGGNILGKTAYYNPESMGVTIFTDYRHPKDIMRELSNKIVHQAQNCRGEFKRHMEVV